MAETGPHVVMLVRNAYTHDTRVEKEVRSLVAAGYRLTVVADAAAGLPEREIRDGCEVIRVPRAAARIPGIRFVLHELRLIRRLRGLRPRILHAHDSNALLAVGVAARRLRIPFVYDAHDLWLARPRRGRTRLYFGLSQAYYTLIERLFVPRAAATLTVSPPIVRHLRDRYGLRQVALVPNYPELADEPEPRDLRGMAGAAALDPELPIALYLGGLMEGRGLEELVDAIAGCAGVQLILLGDGVLAGPLLERAIARGAAGRVHVLPPVPPGDVVAAASSADIGVSPIVPSSLNNRYSLPNKLFQYMAAGIPVVASDFPQVREIIDGTRCGVVTDTRRPTAIASAIEAVLADREEARAMGARGREAVADRYNWSTAASALLEVYEGLRPPNFA